MILDVITTIICLSTGSMIEGNPLMKEIVQSPAILLALKILFTLWIAFLYDHFRGYEKITVIPIYACIVFHLLAVVNNVYQYASL